MKITVTTEIKINPVNTPFKISFTTTKKRGEEVWFTPKGICKIWFGSCHIKHIGSTHQPDGEAIYSMMKKYNTDLLTDGQDVYTTTGSGFVLIKNGLSILSSAMIQWDTHTGNGWKNKKEYVEIVLPLNLELGKNNI